MLVLLEIPYMLLPISENTNSHLSCTVSKLLRITGQNVHPKGDTYL